jgi:hypothetical protein
MNVRFVPLDLKNFPSARKGWDRKDSQFKARWDRTLDLLDKELFQLGANQRRVAGRLPPGSDQKRRLALRQGETGAPGG